MTDTEFYTQIGLSAVGLYLVPLILFFYLIHLYRKYRKPKKTYTEEEIASYNRIKDMTKISRD